MFSPYNRGWSAARANMNTDPHKQKNKGNTFQGVQGKRSCAVCQKSLSADRNRKLKNSGFYNLGIYFFLT